MLKCGVPIKASGVIPTPPGAVSAGGVSPCPPPCDGQETQEGSVGGVCTTHCQEEAFAITATPRDPYYSDELAVMLSSGTTMDTVRIHLEKNVPLVRPLNFRSSLLQGDDGVPTNIRADIEQVGLERMPVNMYSTIPLTQGLERQVSIVDRWNNRWIIITADFPFVPTPSRISPSHQIRGRGACPWWRTGFPDGISTTGVG